MSRSRKREDKGIRLARILELICLIGALASGFTNHVDSAVVFLAGSVMANMAGDRMREELVSKSISGLARNQLFLMDRYLGMVEKREEGLEKKG